MKDFVIALLTCSVSMSALALCYMALTPLLVKRYSERGRYYAWLIIVVGLIIPFRLNFGNAVVNVGIQDGMAMPLIQIGNRTPIIIRLDNGVLHQTFLNVAWWQVAMIVWLAGVVAFIAYHMVKHHHFMKLTLRWSEPITDPGALAVFHALITEMGISRRIDLYLCPSIGSPMMAGFSHPRILLPKVEYTEDELCFIVKHELVHFIRKDLWYKCLILVMSAVHWFNPVVHLMARAINGLCEMSCDTEVVKSADACIRQQYCETIIGVVRHQSRLKTALSTNFYGGKRGMKMRIFTILDTGKKKTGAVIICAALVATIGTGFTFAAYAKSNVDVLPATDVAVADSQAVLQHDYELYTYDEYSKYVAEQRTVLQELLGSPDWSQERVDRVNRIYDENLKGLKNGTLSIVKSDANEAAGAIGSTTVVGKTGEGFSAVVVDSETGKTVNLGVFSTDHEAEDAVKSYLEGID